MKPTEQAKFYSPEAVGPRQRTGVPGAGTWQNNKSAPMPGVRHHLNASTCSDSSTAPNPPLRAVLGTREMQQVRDRPVPTAAEYQTRDPDSDGLAPESGQLSLTVSGYDTCL